MSTLPKYEYETCVNKVDTLPPGTTVEIECIHTGKFFTGRLFQIVGVSYEAFEVNIDPRSNPMNLRNDSIDSRNPIKDADII